MGFDWRKWGGKAGRFGVRLGTGIASGGGSELYRAANHGKADPLTAKGESYVNRIFPEEDTNGNGYLDAFDTTAKDIDAMSAQNDARRKAGLEQSLALFQPSRDLMVEMYGPGAAAPPIDVNAVFGVDPAQTPGGRPLPPNWDPRALSPFNPNPLPPGWDPRKYNPMGFKRGG